MKIRSGFVTNSSSTNFLIVSKKELDEKYLAKKLGFGKNTKFGYLSSDLINRILDGTKRGPKYESVDVIDYDAVMKLFGEEAAERFKELDAKGFHAYIGYTNSDDDCLSAHMTVDSFVIDKRDFYMYGEHCIW
jgi:hypothetical protein